jgi:hypothetical protein
MGGEAMKYKPGDAETYYPPGSPRDIKRRIRLVHGVESVEILGPDDGLEPGEIEIIVDGGDSREIAGAIHEVLPMPVLTIGECEHTIASVAGYEKTVRFSRPRQKDPLQEYNPTMVSVTINDHQGAAMKYQPGDKVEWEDNYGNWIPATISDVRNQYHGDWYIKINDKVGIANEIFLRPRQDEKLPASTILEDLKAAKEKLEHDTGITPDTLIMGSKVKVFYDDFLKKIASEVGMNEIASKTPYMAPKVQSIDNWAKDHIIPYVDTTPAEATDPPFTLELGKTYYAVQSKRTGKLWDSSYCGWTGNIGSTGDEIVLLDCLRLNEDMARQCSENATDPEGNPEPVEIVKIRLVYEGGVK